jgi:YidC/Oxa1 family membrane protein insertase
MEEKKLDINSIIGFVLISGILLWMLYANTPSAEEVKEKEKKEQVEKQAKEAKPAKTVTATTVVNPADATQTAATHAPLGSFGYSATLS